jgi:DNA mismatch repair ATPase MutS
MKRIVEAANAGEKVFILIDEMLRGTNTIDRHTGSMALVKQLVRHNAVAMIASHDLALAALHNDYPVIITNYHFDSTIIDNEIVFDYKLKEGVCQSTNASFLMKKIGIELGD